MLAHSHRHRLQHTVSHAGSYVATLMKVDLAITEQVHGFLGYFHLNEQNSGKVYQLIYGHFQDERPQQATKNIKQMRSKSIIKMNESLNDTTTEPLEYFELHGLQRGRVTFWVN